MQSHLLHCDCEDGMRTAVRERYLLARSHNQNDVISQRRFTEKIYDLDWWFIFVLPVALLNDPCSRQSAISLSVLTLHSVDPASVITPFDVSRICIGGFPGMITFPACPLAISCLLAELASSRSLTSSL